MMPKDEEDVKPYLSVIIPAYDEEKRIGATLEAIYAYLAGQPFTWEVLVVLDGVKDDTLGVVQAFGAGKEHLRWIDRQENRGKGYTIREGMLAARGDIRLFTDADNSTDMAHFDKMKPLFERGANVVICSRDKKDAADARQAVPQPLLKRLLGDLGNLFIQVVAVPGIWDTQCGFKAFRAAAAEKIFSLSRIERFGFDFETLALARRLGYRIEVVGAYWVDEPNTHVTSRDYVNSFVEAMQVRWNLLRGVYNHAQAEDGELQSPPAAKEAQQSW
ncbi:MAG: glycosyltransferase family 2 protein [Chloroflexi bacterium]|nr:glycosyltransferase family 2 protein [Chloroflexota bacterium]MCI0577852.1 glycosyltransferase family 2 protein [Chloroflexota bacterium]MCI0643834.1 glycosyltransferase family 2 protein [Chloroflexota bacterium]MCI0726068.1 glycosyltransferase family 2 protein [Chloroflexota bacterium]